MTDGPQKPERPRYDGGELFTAYLRLKRLRREAAEKLDEWDETTHVRVPLTMPQMHALLCVVGEHVPRR